MKGASPKSCGNQVGRSPSESRSWHGAAWERAGQAWLAVDADGRILDANPAALALLGQGAADLPSRPVSDFLPSLGPVEIRRAVSEAGTRLSGVPVAAAPWAKSPVDIELAPVTAPNGSEAWLVALSEPGAPGSDGELRRLNWALSAHVGALSALAHSTSFEELSAKVCAAIVGAEAEVYRLAWVGRLEPARGPEVRIAAAAGPAAGYVDGLAVSASLDTVAGQGPTGHAIRSGAPWVLADAQTDPGFAPWRERAARFGLRSSVTVPFSDGRAVIGVLVIYASEPGSFGPKELHLFEKLGEELAYAITVEQDRARLKASEEARCLAEAQLQQARKMEAIGQLAGGIAHDFNNVIGAILGFAGFLVEDLPPQSREHGFARKIGAAGERARTLVQQILAFARQSGVERMPSDLPALVRESHDLLRGSLPSTTELRLELPTGPLVAEVNPAQISQVVMNLCVNANDALGGQPGRVTLSLGPAAPTEIAPPAGGEARSGMLRAGALDPSRPHARLAVADTGGGIPPEVLPRIFDPFFTTKERGRGTGLGLSVVHGIVTEYGGAITVESRPESGTTVSIFLPLVAQDRAREPLPAAAAVPGSERVLVVDDEALIAEMLQVGLGRLGYAVTAVHDPFVALELLRESPGRYDAVISDQAMPGMTGLALLREARSVAPRRPLILCSGYADGTTEEMTRAAGVDAFLLKPAPVERIAEILRELLDRR